MSERARVERFRVEHSPLELPLDGSHPVIVGLGARRVTLFLEPAGDDRQPRLEVSIRPPFRFGDSVIGSRSEAASIVDDLLNLEIHHASSTPDDGLELEFVRGERLVAETDWSIDGSDSRHWSPQPGGGIAVWTGVTVRRLGPSAQVGPNVIAHHAEWSAHSRDRPEAPIDIGDGLDLPGPGWVVQGVEVEVSGRLSIQLGPDAPSPDEPRAEPSVNMMQAVEFFATLRADPAATPPDAEVFEAMEGAIRDADLLAVANVWVALDDVEPGIDLSGPAVLGALGRRVARVTVLPGSQLKMHIEGGPELSSRTWWLSVHGDGYWAGAGGQVTRMEEAERVRTSIAELAELAESWLDHDRTGRDSRFWAWERATEVIRWQAESGWILVRLLIDGAADEQQLMSIAAGPLEDLLDEHGASLIDDVERAARADSKVLRALSGVWKNQINDEIWTRIQVLLRRSPDRR